MAFRCVGFAGRAPDVLNLAVPRAAASHHLNGSDKFMQITQRWKQINF